MRSSGQSVLQPGSGSSRVSVLVGCLLAGLCIAVFLQTVSFDFVNFDDGVYVYENPHVSGGLSPQALIWAFGFHEANWHPLTWISLMADAHLAGMAQAVGFDCLHPRAGAYHLTNTLLHAANTVLLFLLLRAMTGALWRSAFAAALFAAHPLHVESVAWVTERKDVLSTLFWFLTMLAYVRWVSAPARARHSRVVILFALGLMAKPMLVTLPVVLMLVDFWPLGRLGQHRGFPTLQDVIRLAREKSLLFALALCSCVLTFWAQRTGGAVMGVEGFPFLPRLMNAVVSYAAYIRNAVWPADLAVFYPMRLVISGKSLTMSFLLLATAGVIAIACARSRSGRWFTVGWFWYAVTLLPVSGIVQVGMQAMADRYTYVPLIGIFIIAAWGIPTLAERVISGQAARAAVLSMLGAAVILAFAAQAYRQTGYWRNSLALFEHALAVTQDNYFAEVNYAAALETENRLEEALRHYRRAASIRPQDYEAPFGIGTVLTRLYRYDEAERFLRRAVKLEPNNAKVRNNLGACF